MDYSPSNLENLNYIPPHNYPKRIKFLFFIILICFLISLSKIPLIFEVKKDLELSQSIILKADSLLLKNKPEIASVLYEKAYYLNRKMPVSKLIISLLLQNKESEKIKAFTYLAMGNDLTLEEFENLKKYISPEYLIYFKNHEFLNNISVQFHYFKLEKLEPNEFMKIESQKELLKLKKFKY